MTFAIQHESAVGIHVQVHPEPLPPPSLPHPSRFSQRTHCNSYPCSSVYNPLQHLASTLDFTLFLCLWFPATLMQYTLIYGGMAVFLLLSVFWASWSMAVWCLFYILKSSWPLLLQIFFFAPFTYPSLSDALITHVLHFFDIIPHFLNNLFYFIFHYYLFIYFFFAF